MRHTLEVDLLESGADRAPLLSRASALMRRRPPRRLLPTVAGLLLVTLTAGALAVGPIGARTERQRVQAMQAAQAAEQAAALAAAPDLAARPLGGTATRTGEAAAGRLSLEVRNGRQPLVLLSVTAQVPGVRFGEVAYRGGRALATDERLELGLTFSVADCALVRRSGRVVLRVIAQGAERDLTLAVAADPASGTGQQFNLSLVLDACG